jgi:hypothetical protein
MNDPFERMALLMGKIAGDAMQGMVNSLAQGVNRLSAAQQAAKLTAEDIGRISELSESIQLSNDAQLKYGTSKLALLYPKWKMKQIAEQQLMEMMKMGGSGSRPERKDETCFSDVATNYSFNEKLVNEAVSLDAPVFPTPPAAIQALRDDLVRERYVAAVIVLIKTGFVPSQIQVALPQLSQQFILSVWNEYWTTEQAPLSEYVEPKPNSADLRYSDNAADTNPNPLIERSRLLCLDDDE